MWFANRRPKNGGTWRGRLRGWRQAWLLGFLAAASAALGEGVVANCTDYDLRSALQGGGRVSFSEDCSITLTNSLVIDAGDTVIDAGGYNVTISGGGQFRIFQVQSNLTLAGLTLTGGSAGSGGAIYVYRGGGVTLTNCLLAGNTAGGFNGLAGSNGATNSTGNGGDGGAGTTGGPGYGGAVYSLGSVLAQDCVFRTNSASGGNGGAGGAGGNGLFNAGSGGGGGSGAAAYGGAIFSAGPLTLTDCSFLLNSATGGNGGAGGTPGSGAYAGRAGVGGAGASASGAAVYATQVSKITGCTFAGNATQGGDSAAGGTLVNGNGSDGLNGGDALGGALCLAGTCYITNSTFATNVVAAGNGGNGGNGTSNAGVGGNGGNGIGGGLLSAGYCAVVNCTLATNSATGGTNGLAGSGAFPAANGNPGLSLGGNLARTAGTLLLQNSIVGAAPSGGAGFGTVIDGKYNLSADFSLTLVAPSAQGVDPKLLPLADNGGPTLTFALATNSPALNKIPATNCPPTDQRGVTRPLGGLGDVGAYESAATVPPLLVTQPADLIVGRSQSATFQVYADGASPLAYQWFFNGGFIAGGTTAAYTRTNLQFANSGAYSVRVTNLFGALTSRLAILTVTNPASPNLTLVTDGARIDAFLLFPTALGYSYVIDYKTNLADAAWIALSTNAGSGSLLTNRYPIDFTSSRFFRVRVP